MALRKASPLAAYLIDDEVTTPEEAAAKGLIHVETTIDGVRKFGKYGEPPKAKAKA